MSLSIKERFNLLLKKNDEQVTTFDESSFTIKLFGGPSQADLIRLEAELINQDKSVNKTIQLNCKWFNKTEQDLVEIEGTAGKDHYQPSLKDVGTIIRVQCFPEIQGMTYEGMPIHRDVGPLVLEKQTEQDAQEFIDSGSVTLLVKVVRSSKSTHYSEVDGLVKVTTDEIIIKTKQGEQFLPLFTHKLDERFPSYQADSKNHKLLKINLDENQFAEVLVQQSRMRDVLELSSKMLTGKKIMDQQQEQQNITQKEQVEQIATATQIPSPTKRPQQQSPTRKKANARDLMQLAQLTKQCKQLTISNDLYKKQVDQYKVKQIEAEQKIKNTQQRLENISKNFFNIEQQLTTLKSKNSTDDDKFLFVNNEIRVLKDSNQNMKKQLDTTNKKLIQTQTQLSKYQAQEEKPTYDVLFDMYIRFKNESEVLSQRLSYAQSQHLKHQQQLQYQKQKNQQLSYNLNKLSNKCQSLVKQNQLSQSPLAKKQSKNFQTARQQQLIRLKLQIKQLVQQNDELRKRSVVKSSQKLQTKSPKKAQLKQLQKLANRLSQTITQKDLQVQQMREVNKQLMLKVKSFQTKEQK